MVLETKSSMEAGVIGAGHSFAGSRLDAQRSVAGAASEAMGGVAYLDYIRQLAARVDADWEGVQADLNAIRCVRCVGSSARGAPQVVCFQPAAEPARASCQGCQRALTPPPPAPARHPLPPARAARCCCSARACWST